MDKAEIKALAEAVVSGQVRAAARVMRALEDELPWARQVMALLHPHTGRAQLVGITGPPGVGKSTLTSALVRHWRKQGRQVGVVAVDPTSPFSGGAILGDRLRMQDHATDPGVFIRSLATRGQFGGLAAAAQGVVRVMEAMGKDVVVIETVGVGQDEVEVVRLADTTVVVTVPGLGDDIQAMKAGLLEVGEILVVNKTDREDAARTIMELEAMVALDEAAASRRDGWRPVVVGTCALEGKGISELAEEIDHHWRFLTADGRRVLQLKRRRRTERELTELIHQGLAQRVGEVLGERLEDAVDELLAGKVDPYQKSQELVQLILQGGGPHAKGEKDLAGQAYQATQDIQGNEP